VFILFYFILRNSQPQSGMTRVKTWQAVNDSLTLCCNELHRCQCCHVSVVRARNTISCLVLTVIWA